MERSLLSELNKANIQAYINAAREAWYKRLFWTQFFNLKYTTQLTWESLTGSAGTPIMADVIEYNASSPIKSRRTIAKAQGDIPKIAMKMPMDEKDYNDYLNMKARATGDSNKMGLLDIIFGDVDKCYTGVLARTEFLCMQALSYGTLALDSTNNNGIITETSVDFGVPAGNKTGVVDEWDQAATAKPITDFEAIVEIARVNGHSLRYAIMDRATFKLFKATTEVKDSWSVYQGMAKSKVVNPSMAQINDFLEANVLPTIILIDSAVRFENSKHVLSNLAPWKTTYVTFVGEMKIGNLLHGPIAEENSPAVAKKAILIKKDHVLITKWSDLEPFAEYTKGQANAFPVFNDVDSIYMMNTNRVTTWS